MSVPARLPGRAHLQTIMRTIRRIYLHTAASGTLKAKHLTVDQIRNYHKSIGWDDIGYHLYIEKDGTVMSGRPFDKIGAGVRGDNSNTLHICVSGHGDLEAWNELQVGSVVHMCAKLIRQHDLVRMFKLNPVRVLLGHREVNDLVNAGLLRKAYSTTKSCPGRKVDMRDIRVKVSQELAKQ